MQWDGNLDRIVDTEDVIPGHNYPADGGVGCTRNLDGLTDMPPGSHHATTTEPNVRPECGSAGFVEAARDGLGPVG